MRLNFWGWVGIVALMPVAAAFSGGPKIGGSETAARLLAGDTTAVAESMIRQDPADDSQSRQAGGNAYPENTVYHIAPDLAASEAGCMDKCGGHASGWRWAEQAGVIAEIECGGRSSAFKEGCKSYARSREASLADSVPIDEAGF